MNDLPEFLRACIAEEKAVALAAEPGPWVVGTTSEPVWAPGRGAHWGKTVFTPEGEFPQRVTVRGTHVASKSAEPRMVADMARGYLRSRHEATSEHIALWNPKRVIDQLDANLRIVDRLVRAADVAWSGSYAVRDDALDSLRDLALPYADRPGYREEWRPEESV